MPEADQSGVEQFTINEPMEEVHRKLFEDFELINWCKMSVNNSYTIMVDNELFNFDTVKSGVRSTDVIWRTDMSWPEEGADRLKAYFDTLEENQ